MPGFRLEKLEVTELIEMVYEDCSVPGSPAAALQEELDRRYREKLEELKEMSEGKVRKLFRDLAVFLKGRGVRVEVYGVESCTALDLKQVADLFVPIDQAWLFSRPSA